MKNISMVSWAEQPRSHKERSVKFNAEFELTFVEATYTEVGELKKISMETLNHKLNETQTESSSYFSIRYNNKTTRMY